MSDKHNRKIVEQYANLRKDYNKLMFGLDVSTSKIEQEILSRLSVNEIAIEDVQHDIDFLQVDLENLKSSTNYVTQLPTGNKKSKKCN